MAWLMADVGLAEVIHLIVRALAMALTFVVARFVYRGVKVRLRFRRMARQGIPIMPHSWLLGHIPHIIQFRKDFPPDLHVSMFQVEVMKRYKKYFPGLEAPPPVVYLDVWPVGDPICFSVDPAVSSQFTQTKSLPKSDMVKYLLRPLCDDRDLVSLEGNEWKLWRSRFNPGFSTRNITALVPTILEELDIFIHQLEKQAGPDGTWGDVFQLEQKAMNLTFDVIGRAALDVKFHEQSRPEPSAFKNAFFGQLSFMMMGASISSITARYLPAYARVKAKNDKVMDDFLVPYVQQRDDVVKNQELTKSATSEKFIIDLALKSIQKDGGSSQLHSQPDGLLMKTLLSQLKVFLFAGHDTTASTIAWAFHLLSRHPKTLEKLRAEHDSVFGSSHADIEKTSSRIAASPHLLNQIPYTVAVIKETLRLQPPASSWRQGQPEFFLSVPGSEIPYPTDGFLVNDTTRTLQQHSESWERSGDFVPERFLSEEDKGSDDVKIRPPPVNGWRPFVHGPRNCIGQELAMVELKLVLVLVARRFDVECAWNKWDAAQVKAGITQEKWAYEGDRLYPYGESTAHCKDNMPAHVRLRSIP